MFYNNENNLIEPETIFKKVYLREGMHIADFGCGRNGHVVFSGAKQVGSSGVVYAVDILKEVLDLIKNRSEIEKLDNIEVVWADLESENSLAIVPKTLDIVFLIKILYQFKNYEICLNEAARILKDKSRIVVIDWSKSLAGLSPKENEFIDFEKIKSWAKKNNFVVQEEFNLGKYYHGVILFRN